MDMCAINGFNFRDQGLILKMNKANNHRGPDQADFWLGNEVSFGHNRLSIIDLSENGRQPMWDAERTAVIIFNGEIYNFQELRRDLEKKYKFKSQSDTEVILCAYKEYGLDCLNKLNGIFAFAIWDDRKKELLLARDRMGVKPLYYFWDPSAGSGQSGKLIFSSEIKSILEHDISREVDPEAFNLYFHVLYAPEPYTMFKSVKKLPQASYLVLKNGKIDIKKYWEITDFENFSSYSQTREKIADIFKDSIKRQLISDRPAGVFLSGGLDSTAVLGATAEVTPGKIKTFSVGFETDIQQEKFNADFSLARKTANFYKTDHHELFIGAKDIGNNLEKIAWHLDEPNANPTAGAIFLLSKMAKEKVAVVLGGDGGDELFGGYPRYYFSRLIGNFQKLPVIIQKLVLNFMPARKDKLVLGNDAQKILAFLSQKQGVLESVINSKLIPPGSVSSYFKEKYFRGAFNNDFEKQFMNIDRQSWLADESLLRSDKMTMAFGLEQRVPVLDYRLVELTSKIPSAWKFNQWQNPANFQGKRIWRDAISKYLLPHVAKEQKRGWFTPMAKWLRGDLKNLVSEILSPQNLNKDFFNTAGVQKIWQDHLEGRVYNLNLIWAIVMWHLWYNQFIKQR